MTALTGRTPRRQTPAPARPPSPPAQPARAGLRSAPMASRREGSSAAPLPLQVEIAQLVREFGDSLPADHITAAFELALARVRARARLTQFVPVFAYRYARAELRGQRSLSGGPS